LRIGDDFDGAAFLPRPLELDGVSCNWFEFHPAPEEDRLRRVRAAARLTYSRNGCLVRISVGTAIDRVLESTGIEIAVRHDPLNAEPEHPDPRFRVADESHALIAGLPNVDDPKGELAGDAIARSVVMSYPAIAG
jgi:hypothetical protein